MSADYEEFLATIPENKKRYLGALEPKHRRRVETHWWLWWASIGRKVQRARERQGRLFADWDEGPWSKNPDGQPYVLVQLSNTLWVREDPRPYVVWLLDGGYNDRQRAEKLGRYPTAKVANKHAEVEARKRGITARTFPARNPDEPARRIEREAFAGGVQERARHLMQRVRSGEVPMSHVALACALAGRQDACALDPPPYDDQYILADRRDLVRWALALDSELPGSVSRRIERRDIADQLHSWMAGGKRPGAVGASARRFTGSAALLYDAVRMARARTNLSLHRLVKRMVSNYRVAVWQSFMRDTEEWFEPGPRKRSPAWRLKGPNGKVVTVSVSHGTPTFRYDQLLMARAAEHQATDLLGRILLREE